MYVTLCPLVGACLYSVNLEINTEEMYFNYLRIIFAACHQG